MLKRRIAISLLFLSVLAIAVAQTYTVKIARLKYKGGGDWYANPTSLSNLAKFCNKTIGTSIDPNIPDVDVGSVELHRYPFVHMTGHGNVVFSADDISNLRKYLTSGGFLHIDDNYGMDPYVRREMKRVFPELDFVELGSDHPIFHQKFNLPGLPKIHEHDGKPARAYALIWQGRMVCMYSYECDLGDGWEDRSVHNDNEDVRTKAFQMGANLIEYVFTR